LKHRTINILSISEAVESCKKKLQKLQKLALLITFRSVRYEKNETKLKQLLFYP